MKHRSPELCDRKDVAHQHLECSVIQVNSDTRHKACVEKATHLTVSYSCSQSVSSAIPPASTMPVSAGYKLQMPVQSSQICCTFNLESLSVSWDLREQEAESRSFAPPDSVAKGRPQILRYSPERAEPTSSAGTALRPLQLLCCLDRLSAVIIKC